MVFVQRLYALCACWAVEDAESNTFSLVRYEIESNLQNLDYNACWALVTLVVLWLASCVSHSSWAFLSIVARGTKNGIKHRCQDRGCREMGQQLTTCCCRRSGAA